MSDGDSPAARYAAARERQAASRTRLAEFRTGLSFTLDDFQVAGARAVEDGRGVLVAAPTGAGKTVVGEFSCYLALRLGRKAFYTTPIKALSNQKYADLVAVHGPDNVGLLTGDQSVNSGAPIVVMTTEVLRNMLYADSKALDGLGYVVMDEVHYLADRFRGGVWEEVILHLRADVQVVSLSATVSNAEEFGAWLEAVRGDTAVIVSERRPVPLGQHLVIGAGHGGGARLLDLYPEHIDPADAGPNPPINPEIYLALRSAPIVHGGDRGFRGRGGRRVQVAAPRRAPSRTAVLRVLQEAKMLPAIFFVFSRAGCEAGVRQLVTSGVNLTRASEADQIREIVAERTSHVSADDLDALGFWGWSAALERGVAAHHAGMLSVFKETVEYLFTRGLVKVVFATETLALGINMPARSVVLDRLVKWDGTAHVEITAGEYTQLTGRAGRRGIDTRGHAIVADHPNMDPVHVAGLASRRTYPLRSSFTPTSNMAVNLVDRLGVKRAREVLEMSFAQFQADRGVVDLARQAQAASEGLEGYASAMACDRGDFTQYMGLRAALREAERDEARSRRGSDRDRNQAVLDRLVPGDVVARAGRYVVVIGPADTGPGLSIMTAQGKVKTLTTSDVVSGTEPVARLRLRKKFSPRVPAARRHLAEALTQATHDLPAPTTRRAPQSPGNTRVQELRSALRAHPCHSCPDRDDHARWAQRHQTLTKEHATLTRKIAGRTGSIARDFDRVCTVLTELGYMTIHADTLTVTPDGQWLGRLYAENDLLLAECVRQGAWNGLDAPGLSALVCAVVYSGRGEHTPIHVPGALTGSVDETVRLWSRLDDLRTDHGATPSAPLDLTLVGPMWRWARGEKLADILRDTDLAAGDFVRWCKQVVDILDQLSAVAPDPAMRATASAAIARVRRGVVALGTL